MTWPAEPGFWTWVLVAAALYNIVIGLGGAAAKGASREGRLLSLMVVAFGIVYAIAALDPARFAPVLWAGVFGKIAAIAVMAPAVGRGDAPRALGPVLAGDAFFTSLFAWLLVAGA